MFWAALSLCSALGALAVPVTFQVDMSYQAAQAQFDPSADKVEARGSFNGWSAGFALTNSVDNPTLYTGATEIAGDAASTVEYKFVKISAGTETWETSNNRSFTLGSAAQTLPVAFFNNQWDGPAVNVTFQVNMATQIAAHNFDPTAGDAIESRGAFNGWSGGFVLEPSADNPDVYVGTTSVPDAPGSQIEYKFHIARGNGGEQWENDPNRKFVQATADQTLPAVYFNNVTGTPIKAALNLAVDMSAQISGGKFDPTAQEVWARGNKIGWGNPPEGLQLIADASRAGVYTNTIVMDGAITGDSIEFKFTIWDPTASSTTWEDGANKTATFSGTEPTDANGYHVKTVGLDYFNGIRPEDILSADTLVTFRVDMNGATRFGGTAFDRSADSVYINGTFVNNGSWGPWSTQDASYLLYDDGATAGDTVAGDGIYSFQTIMPKGSPTRVAYKYGINSDDNEAPSGNDHVRYIRATATYTFPLDKFGAPTQETQTQDAGSISVALGAPGHVIITWNGQPGVKLQKVDLTNGAASDVPNTDGASRADVTADGQSGFYRLVKP
jgi:hypothetical protein